MSAFSRWGSVCHHVELGVSRFIPSTLRSAEPHHRVQVPDHVVDLLAWAAVDEVHVAAEPEFLAALHYAQHVRDTALLVGTLSGILGGVAAHLRSTRDALVERLFGP